VRTWYDIDTGEDFFRYLGDLMSSADREAAR
jgi:hypothetical protein